VSAVAVAVAPRGSSLAGARGVGEWTRWDTASAVGWFVLALAARAPLVARIEGVLDHDQSIVGLMAMEIAAGRRLPIFFDGQRYMGAVEPYVAALLVALFGHSPVVVALAPWLFFGLFVAGQYALWRRWGDRVTGHLAALVSVVCAPMLTLWSIVPRGGYIELLAWAIPVLGVYRAWTRPGASPPLRPVFYQQFPASSSRPYETRGFSSPRQRIKQANRGVLPVPEHQNPLVLAFCGASPKLLVKDSLCAGGKRHGASCLRSAISSTRSR